MIRLRVALHACLLVPSLALAQRGGGGGATGSSRGTGKTADWNSVGAKAGPSGPTISPKDFQEKSIFQLYFDKKKDLKLSDAQVAAFTDADAKLKDANADRFKLLDSLKQDAKPRTSGDPSAEEMARLAIAKDVLQGVIRDIRASYDDAAKASVAGMDEPQQKRALELMEKYTEEMQNMLREKAGARGGPSGPEGGRRGRRGDRSL